MKLMPPLTKWIGKSNKEKQFNQLLELHYPKLYRLSYAWSQQKQIAQDLVQETLLKAIEKQHQLQNLQDLEPWLCKIMHNLFLDRLRYQKKWQFAETDEIDLHLSAQSCEEVCINAQTEVSIHQAMGRLSVEQREVVTLVDLQGFSYQETANILDIPVGTIMSRLSRARSKLKLMLEQDCLPASSDKVVYLRRQK